MTPRHYHLIGATGKVRRASLHGREYLVVPVIALVEGVIHAVNADEPEFVPRELLAKAAHTWNGRPLVVWHPTRNGEQVSANDPEVIERQAFGTIFKSALANGKLAMEAWVDPQRLRDLGEHALLKDLEEGKPVEVSVGAFVMTVAQAGTYKGHNFKAAWVDATGDHLAFLPGGQGACSMEMGCGAHRAAQRYGIDVTGFVQLEKDVAYKRFNDGKLKPIGEPRALSSLRERLSAMVLAMVTPMRAAVQSGEPAQVTYGAMQTILDQAGEFWDDLNRLISELSMEEDATPEMTEARLEAVQMICGSMSSLLSSIYSQTMHSLVKDLPPTSDPLYMEAFRAAVGKRNSAKDMKFIQSTHDGSHQMHAYMVGLGAACNDSEHKALANATDCKCGGHRAADQGVDMTKVERIAALMKNEHNPLKDQKTLEAASDDALMALEAHCTAATTKAAELKAAQDKNADLDTRLKAAEAKIAEPITEERALAALPSVRSLV